MIVTHRRTTAPNFHTEVVQTHSHEIIFHIPPKGAATVTWRRNGSTTFHTFSKPRLNDVKQYFHSTCRVLASNVGIAQEWQ